MVCVAHPGGPAACATVERRSNDSGSEAARNTAKPSGAPAVGRRGPLRAVLLQSADQRPSAPRRRGLRCAGFTGTLGDRIRADGRGRRSERGGPATRETRARVGPLVFVSHDSRDADLAEALSKLLMNVSAGMLKSFRSSDRKGAQGIDFGVEWQPRADEQDWFGLRRRLPAHGSGPRPTLDPV